MQNSYEAPSITVIGSVADFTRGFMDPDSAGIFGADKDKPHPPTS